MRVPFHRPNIGLKEREYADSVFDSGMLRAGGEFTIQCEKMLSARLDNAPVLLTTSATSAIDMALLLCDVGPGDEVILPAFTFVSCASAIVMRGGIPVFVDVEPDTMNIDPASAAGAVTSNTKAVLAIHYAGVPYDVTALAKLAKSKGLPVIEDAAHAIASAVGGREAGGFGNFGVMSFHHTKNVSCGEGGALIVNDRAAVEKAHVFHKYGTDYDLFRADLASSYTWQDRGSSFMPSDLTAAVLLAQLERADDICDERRAIWFRYQSAFEELETFGAVRPRLPAGTIPNGHIYFLILPKNIDRASFIQALALKGIETTSHYVSLDLSPAGRRFGRAVDDLSQSHSAAERLVRLPIWVGLGALQDEVIDAVMAEFRSRS